MACQLDLVYAGAARQVALLSAREISARELVQAHLDQIERVDPKLNAYRVVCAERALEEAGVAQAKLDAGERLPLLGVAVAIKDDVDVAGEVTAWGTSAHGRPAAHDSEVVRRLRAAGAIPIGKTHVPEMTQWPFTESATFGITRNPWDLGRTPGGSSGGTGAAVAAGMAGLGLGSDGGGSIRIPAAWCGLFGLKPHRDRVPLAPHDDAWNGLSVNGPIARTVADAALFLDATANGGGFAEAAAREPGRLRIAVSLRPPRPALGRPGADQRSAVEGTAELLRSLGHEVIEREIDYGPSTWPDYLVRYLHGIHVDVKTMPHAERLERRTRAMARMGRLAAPLVRHARARERAIAARAKAIFDVVDVVLTPGPLRGPYPVGRFHSRGALWTMIAAAPQPLMHPAFNATGQPVAAVPAGLDADGLPMAVQLAGRPRDEATLLSLSAQIEAIRPWAHRRPPID